MSAGDFTQGQQRRSRVWEEGFRCVWELAWMDGALSGTLNRLRDHRASEYTELNFSIPSAGLAAQRGNPAPAQTRGVFPLILMGISPITVNQQPKHAQTLRGHPAPGRDSSSSNSSRDWVLPWGIHLAQENRGSEIAVSCAEPGLGFDHPWGSLPAQDGL